MSDPTNPNPPKKHGCFFYGCITAVVGLLAFVGIMIAFFFYGKSIVGPVADDFLQHVDKNEYPQAYAMLGDGWKQTATLQEFTNFEKRMQCTFGPMQSKTMSNWSMYTKNGETTGSTTYQVQFTKGTATLTFNLIKADGIWKINGLRYQSKLLEGPATPAASPDASKDAPDGVGKKATDEQQVEEPTEK